MRQTQITINVELDENHVPEKMMETLKDGGVKIKRNQSHHDFSLGRKTMEALHIDLWTKDMPVDQMKMFLHQIFVSWSYLSKSNWRDDVMKNSKFAEDF